MLPGLLFGSIHRGPLPPDWSLPLFSSSAFRSATRVRTRPSHCPDFRPWVRIRRRIFSWKGFARRKEGPCRGGRSRESANTGYHLRSEKSLKFLISRWLNVFLRKEVINKPQFDDKVRLKSIWSQKQSLKLFTFNNYSCFLLFTFFKWSMYFWTAGLLSLSTFHCPSFA